MTTKDYSVAVEDSCKRALREYAAAFANTRDTQVVPLLWKLAFADGAKWGLEKAREYVEKGANNETL